MRCGSGLADSVCNSDPDPDPDPDPGSDSVCDANLSRLYIK